jgi:anti-sigma regulatory factor (Ser/Thr protein kinase)
MPDADAVLTLALPGRAGAAAAARTALTTLNGNLHLVSEPRLRDAQLLVSELVTNAVEHSGSGTEESVRISVLASRERVRVEVTDPGVGFDESSLDAPTMNAPHGFGLHIVGELATRWGVDRGDVTTVWFELDRPRRRFAPAVRA